MTSTRRITSLLAVAAAFTCLGGAAEAQAVTSPLGPPISPIAELDAITSTGIPAESRGQLPTVRQQLGGLSRLHELHQLHQLTDQAAPVAGLLPAIST
ncbi:MULTISPECIES: hypothetical protein [unclassified Streptomyces]|uniref:hypothetical protein n=1 Tax=unclassified Streptomyces TaxID=2593676 RepID=UPI001660D5CB|nr:MULTISPECIES: hypothetical protein [unclassified Streptomyces]MBD0711556.1 hypothetical protein [Streptomyces sp. CBMA291]MBD0716560.1 hypothetical protein [Streptomyces sp. CBMA370]